MEFSLELPNSALPAVILSIVSTSETRSLVNHSVRSFLFAQLVAIHEGCLGDAAYDRDLLFAATVLHNLGIGDLAKGQARFEVVGADLAAELLHERGVPEKDVDRVWEAIALHTSPGIAERHGLLTYLTRVGIGMDFGRHPELLSQWGEQIHAAYARLNMVRSLVDAIIERAVLSEAAAPRYSIGGELLRERREHGVTSIERAGASSPWGE